MPPLATSSPAPPRLDAIAVPRATRRLPWWSWLVIAAGLVGVAVLWQFEPAGQPFFPRCWLYQTTGLQCPSCGATRALHALLHGQFAAAFRLNPLVFVVLPLTGWLGLRFLHGWRTGRWWANPLAHPTMLALLAGLTVGFGLARNVGW